MLLAIKVIKLFFLYEKIPSYLQSLNPKYIILVCFLFFYNVVGKKTFEKVTVRKRGIYANQKKTFRQNEACPGHLRLKLPR